MKVKLTRAFVKFIGLTLLFWVLGPEIVREYVRLRIVNLLLRRHNEKPRDPSDTTR